MATPDKQYQKILTQKFFTPSFFKDSAECHTSGQQNSHNALLLSTASKAHQSDDSESASSFKLSKEHCLNIFNTIKCFNDQIGVTQPEDKKKYYSALESINEKDRNMSYLPGADKTASQKKAKAERRARREELEDQEVPQSLQDIFKISIRNRKRNKQKKRHQSDCSSDCGSNASVGPIENVNQIIANQYRMDQQPTSAQNEKKGQPQFNKPTGFSKQGSNVGANGRGGPIGGTNGGLQYQIKKI